MKRPPSWSGSIVALLVGIALSVVIWLPASAPTVMVAKITEGRLDFRHERGTVWAGSTELALVKPNKSDDSVSIPGRIHWRWRWQGWIPELVVNSDCCFSQPVTFKLFLGSVAAVDVSRQDELPFGNFGRAGRTLQHIKATR